MGVMYRLQDGAGRGPFKPGFTEKWLSDKDDLDELKPFTPREIFNAKMKSSVEFPVIGCCCSSADDLKKWFTKEEYFKLRLLGYKSVMVSQCEFLAAKDYQVLIGRTWPFTKGIKQFELYRRE